MKRIPFNVDNFELMFEALMHANKAIVALHKVAKADTSFGAMMAYRTAKPIVNEYMNYVEELNCLYKEQPDVVPALESETLSHAQDTQASYTTSPQVIDVEFVDEGE